MTQEEKTECSDMSGTVDDFLALMTLSVLGGRGAFPHHC